MLVQRCKNSQNLKFVSGFKGTIIGIKQLGKEKKCNEIIGSIKTWVMNTKNKSNNIKNIEMFQKT